MDDIEHRLERIETAIVGLTSSIDERFKTLSDRLGRQVAVTEALRSDVRLFASIAQAMLGAVQGFAGSAADLSGRVTDLENRG